MSSFVKIARLRIGAALAAGVLLLGVYIPPALHDVLARAATSLGGGAP